MPADPSDSARSVGELARSLPPGTVCRPGAEQYTTSTSPDNSSFPQRPGAVVRPRTAADAAADVAATVTLALALGLRVGVQATGHGAGSTLDDGLVLVDTSRLDAVSIDPKARTARVGAGVTRSKVQEQAETHQLLALSGTSPSVGVPGYAFNGGVGWLARPFGLASSSLRTVEYVDGVGRIHHVSDDRADEVEREALWAFRGGAPVGLATELEFDLFPVSDLWAGYLLWPAGHLTALAAAWTGALAPAPDTLTSALALLQLPAQGPFPETLLNTTVGAPVLRLDRRRAGPDAAAGRDARGRRARGRHHRPVRRRHPFRHPPRPAGRRPPPRHGPLARAAPRRSRSRDLRGRPHRPTRRTRLDRTSPRGHRRPGPRRRPHPAARPAPAARGRRRRRRPAASGRRLLPRPGRDGGPAS